MSEQPGVADPAEPAGPELRLGIVPLRPLSVPDLLRGSVDAVRRNPGALLGVGLLVAVAAELAVWAALVLTFGGAPAPADVAAPAAAALPALAASLIRIAMVAVVGTVLQAVVNTVVPRAVFGHSMGAGAALRAGSGRLPALLGVTALTGLLVGAAAGLGTLVMLVNPLGALLALPLFGLVVYLTIALLFAPSVAVVEGASPVAALRRSRALVHSAPPGWWRVLAVALIAAVAGALVSGVLSAVFDAVSGGGAFAGALASILVGTVVTPLTLALHTLLYIDNRCRSEGIEGLWRTAG